MYNLTTQTYGPLGRLLMSGLIAAGLVGGGFAISEFNTAGAPSPTEYTIIDEPFNAFVTATGSTSITQRYAATCIPNPLKTAGLGSGTIIRLTYHSGTNHTGVGGDAYLTKDCDDHTSTGHTLVMDNVCTATGCVSYYTTGTQAWNGVDYLKFTLRGDPGGAAKFTGRITGRVENIYGE